MTATITITTDLFGRHHWTLTTTDDDGDTHTLAPKDAGHTDPATLHASIAQLRVEAPAADAIDLTNPEET
jgi:hypothetical protein